MRTRNNNEGFAYFYCSRNEHERQDPDSIFRAILKQLCYQANPPSIHKPVIEKYDQRREDGFALGDFVLGESQELIIKLLNIYPQTTIVIDALDESDPATRDALLDALQEIISRPSNLVKIFVSSRDDSDITSYLKEVPNLYIEATDNVDDISRFVQSSVSECIRKKRLLNGKVNKELEELICSTLRENAHGM